MKNGIKHEFEGTGSVCSLDSPLKTASGKLPMTAASETAQDRLAFDKAQILSALKAAGIALVTADYSGCCDDGQIDRLVATGPESENGPAPEIALPEAKVTLRTAPFDGSNMFIKTVSIAEAIENLWWEELSDRVGGWEINEGGEGVLELDVASGEVGVWHTQHPVSDGPDGEEW